MANKEIPKAKDLFHGDINEAVIAVQKAVGIDVTPEWWGENVGNNGSTDEILGRFDQAYQKLVESKNP